MSRSNAIEISARWRWIAALLLSLHAISPAQQIAIGAHPVPAPPLAPRGITAGPDGALWFTERGASNIGRITTAGAKPARIPRIVRHRAPPA